MTISWCKVVPPFVTSEAILFEVGNALALPPHRQLGIRTLQQIRADAGIEIINLDRDLFERTIAFYLSRPDKEWGLTDCSSFVIMRERGLIEVLSADKHFEQAGYKSLIDKL